jgi:hypothetical protein
MPQWAFSELYYDLGKIYGNQSYLNTATYLQGQTPAFVIAAILVVIAGLIVIANTNEEA